MSHRRLAPQSREQPRLWLWQTQITQAIELSRPVCARKWRAAASELKEQREDMNFPEVYFSPFFSFTLSTTAQRSNQSAESECFVALQGDVNKEKEASCQAWLPVLWLWWQIDGRQGANGPYILRRWGTSSMSALKAETVVSTCAYVNNSSTVWPQHMNTLLTMPCKWKAIDFYPLGISKGICE